MSQPPSVRRGMTDGDTVEDLGVVLYERAGAVARIVLNRPEKANAQTSEMVWQVDACLDRAERDTTVKVVVIKANGKGFCAGHAIGDAGSYPEFDASFGAVEARVDLP